MGYGSYVPPIQSQLFTSGSDRLGIFQLSTCFTGRIKKENHQLILKYISYIISSSDFLLIMP